MSSRSIKSIPEDKEVAGDAATPTSEISAKEQRMNMITGELDVILKNAQDYVLRHLAEDLGEDVKDPLRKAAMKLAYRKQYYDVMEDKVVYFPSCKQLIMSCDLMEQAEKFYYDEEDEFPPEFSKALKTVASAAESRKMKDKSGRKAQAVKDTDSDYDGVTDEDDYDESLIGKEESLDSDVMAKLAMSWSEAFDETVEYRKVLC